MALTTDCWTSRDRVNTELHDHHKHYINYDCEIDNLVIQSRSIYEAHKREVNLAEVLREVLLECTLQKRVT